MNNEYGWSNSPYTAGGVASQPDAPSEAFGLYVNRDDRSEYIEFNHDGTFLQYERNSQFIGKFSLDRSVLRMAFSDGRTAKMLLDRYAFTDQQGRTWVKKERVRSSAPLAPNPTVSQPASRPVKIWALAIIAVAAFVTIATQWSNIEKWLRKTSSRHYSESTASWEARTLPGTGMTVDLPSEPDKDESSIPAADAHYFEDMKAYGKEYDNLEYAVMYLYARDGVELDAEEGAHGGMEEFGKEPGVVGLEYNISTPYPGQTSISGTCIYLGKAASVGGLVQARGSKLWAIFTVSRTDDSEACAAAKRIMSSARFE